MVGGMVANNSSGMCCGVSQNTYHTLRDLRAVFADGSVLDTADPASCDAWVKVRHPAASANIAGQTLSPKSTACCATCAVRTAPLECARASLEGGIPAYRVYLRVASSMALSLTGLAGQYALDICFTIRHSLHRGGDASFECQSAKKNKHTCF